MLVPAYCNNSLHSNCTRSYALTQDLPSEGNIPSDDKELSRPYLETG
jgi:hypothetical protein